MTLLQPARANRLLSFPELETLPERINRLFGRDFPAVLPDGHALWGPAANLRESEEEYVLSAELPGMNAKDVEIDVQDNVLTMSGEKKTESEKETEKNGHWHLLERTEGRFERSFSLPRSVNPEGIRAEFENGVLTVHLPKRAESKGRRVMIAQK
jgi:HSP20 family protein